MVTTERLIIRRYLKSDAAALASAANYTSVHAGMSDGFPSPYTLSNAEEFITRQPDPSVLGYPHAAGIFLKPTNTPGNTSLSEPLLIGSIGSDLLGDVLYRTWEIGYFLTPTAWGKGYATEAIGGFVRWVFATWPALNRIEGNVYGSNKASIRLLSNCGFVEEGRKRGAVEKNGELLDLVVFGLLRDDLEQKT